MPGVNPVAAPARSKPAEKKSRTPKETKTKVSKPSATAHPPYFQMIKEAILALHERTGSSPHAIAKHMEEKHKAVLPANFKKMLAVQLKKHAAKGALVKVKASFKLSESGKKEGKEKEEKPKPAPLKRKAVADAAPEKKKKPTAPLMSPKVAKAKKKMVVGKAKKVAPAKPKQPKTIKSPAAKRAKKAAA